MTEQIYNLLKMSYQGNEVIAYIQNLERANENLRTDVEMLTLERKTLTEQLRHVMDENKRLQQLADADSKYVCERKPECRG